MADDLSQVVEPELEGSSAATLIRKGIMDYANGSHAREIHTVNLYGKYGPWALMELQRCGYDSARVMKGVITGGSGLSGNGVWNVDVDNLVILYGKS